MGTKSCPKYHRFISALSFESQVNLWSQNGKRNAQNNPLSCVHEVLLCYDCDGCLIYSVFPLSLVNLRGVFYSFVATSAINFCR